MQADGLMEAKGYAMHVVAGAGSLPTLSCAQGSGLGAWANWRACENGGVGKEQLRNSGLGEKRQGLRSKSPNLEGLGCGNIWDCEFPPSPCFCVEFGGEMRGCIVRNSWD
jgi:hypothetical protein